MVSRTASSTDDENNFRQRSPLDRGDSEATSRDLDLKPKNMAPLKLSLCNFHVKKR